MAEPTLYLFDGYNLLHAGGFDEPRELIDRLASFVALQGARGVVSVARSHDELQVFELPLELLRAMDLLCRSSGHRFPLADGRRASEASPLG